jgi:hypothetical protein
MKIGKSDVAHNKDFEQVIRKAENAGWRYQQGKKHARLISPNGEEYISVSVTPSDVNAGRQLLRDLKRKGFVENYVHEKPNIVYKTPEVDPAVEAAKAIDQRIQDHTAAGAARRFLRENPDKTHTVDEISMVAMARVPSANKLAVQAAISGMVNKGEVTRVGRGLYRWGEKGAGKTDTPPPAEPARQVNIGTLTGDASLDQDLEAIDQALVALGVIEEVVQRVHAKVEKLAELKRMLG